TYGPPMTAHPRYRGLGGVTCLCRSCFSPTPRCLLLHIPTCPSQYGYRCPLCWMAVAFPPVEPTDQLFDMKTKPCHVQSRLGRGIAADPVTVGDHQCFFIELPDGLNIHGPVWEVDGTRDMLLFKGLRCWCVNNENFFTRLKCHLQIPRVRFVGQLVFIVLQLFVH